VAFTGHPYPATAEPVSDTRVVCIPADHVVKCIRGMPDIALAMIASTSQHLHHMVQRVEQLKARTGVQRVAEFLASLCPASEGPCTIAWTDGMLGKQKDTMVIIDKRTLEVVRQVTPSPGQTAAHVEFDKSGRHALVSIWEDPGGLVIYDAETFVEKKRLPMSRPSGKYNVWNKISLSDGTSH
jgi:cytochrome d1-like heme-containing protein